jgi:hypothetical protein
MLKSGNSSIDVQLLVTSLFRWIHGFLDAFDILVAFFDEMEMECFVTCWGVQNA